MNIQHVQNRTNNEIKLNVVINVIGMIESQKVKSLRRKDKIPRQ